MKNRGRFTKWKSIGKYGYPPLEYEKRTRAGKEGIEVEMRLKNPPIIITPAPLPQKKLLGIKYH